MKHVPGPVCWVVLFLLVMFAPAARGDITVDVGRGSVVVHVPNSYDPNTPAPLLLVLHGYTSSGQAMKNWFQLGALSEQYGFVYAAPDGTMDSFGFRFWNATNACCDFFNSNVDDSAYLLALINEIKAQLNVADKRVHLLGHSNGGFMSYQMACDHADVIASIASLAGATWANPASCSPSSPVHVLQIHGTSDGTINYNGGNIGGVPYPGAQASVLNWVQYNGCSTVADTSAPNLNLDSGIGGAETTVVRYESQCNPGGSGELWTIVGGAHSPNLSSQFSPNVIAYLMSHPKPGTWSDLGNGLAGISGIPALTGVSTLVEGEAIAFDLSNARQNATAVFISGSSELSVPFKGGTLVPSVELLVIAMTDGNGDLVLAGSVPPGLPPSTEVYAQFWISDAAGPLGYSASNAVRGVTP